MTHARNRMLFRFVGIVVLVYDICDRLFGLSNFCTVCSGIYGWNYLETNVDFFYCCTGTHYELKIAGALLHLSL